jgi:phospholipid/cholesterol/gamma-HCH transport system ATP-binding protein
MIEFKEVHKDLGGRRIINGLCLKIPKGKISFIIGKSGEGKSVTLKHILGLMLPDSGSVIIDGLDITNFSSSEMRKMRLKFGVLFQQGGLFDSLTVEENILFPLIERNASKVDLYKLRLERVLKKLELEKIRYTSIPHLSIGEHKRVALARALIIDPKYLIYDEPTTGMDPIVSEMIDNVISDLNCDNKELTSIVVSHDLKSTLTIADHIILLKDGKAVFHGNASDFRGSNLPIVKQFLLGKNSKN